MHDWLEIFRGPLILILVPCIGATVFLAFGFVIGSLIFRRKLREFLEARPDFKIVTPFRFGWLSSTSLAPDFEIPFGFLFYAEVRSGDQRVFIEAWQWLSMNRFSTPPAYFFFFAPAQGENPNAHPIWKTSRPIQKLLARAHIPAVTCVALQITNPTQGHWKEYEIDWSKVGPRQS